MYNQKGQKTSKIYECKFCDYITCKKNAFERHLSTDKHKKRENTTNTTEKEQFLCVCGKSYKYRSSLFNHKKVCKFTNARKGPDDKSENLKELVVKLMTENNDIKNTLVEENKELRKQIGELIPKVGNTTNNINQKNKFNINIFLNEQCKDALNINDFVKSIEISLEQLDFTKNNGLADGLSNAIIENINKLSLFERPLHCTDVKRETLYIKDNDNWEKDCDKIKIKKVIKDVSDKQFRSIKKWTDANPDFKENENKQDYFAKVLSVLGQDASNIDEKIIKKLCTKSYLEKNKN